MSLEGVKSDSEEALKTLRKIRDSLEYCEADESLKRLFQTFVDGVEVYEGYVTIALNIFYILGCHTATDIPNYEKRPPLENFQMVVWNGGGEGQPVLTTKYPISFVYSMRDYVRKKEKSLQK